MTTYNLSTNQTAMDPAKLAELIRNAQAGQAQNRASAMDSGRPAGRQDSKVRVGSGRAYDPTTSQYYDAHYTKSSGMGIGDILRIAAPIALSFIAPGIGTALGTSLGATGATASAIGNAAIGAGVGAIGGGGLKGAAIGGLTGGVGGYLSGGGGVGGDVLGSMNKAGLGNTAYSLADGGGIGSVLSSFGADVGGGIGSGILSNANTLLNAASIGSQLFGSNQQGQALESQKISTPSAQPFSPVRPQAASTPASLSQMSSFDPEQQRSALATKGVNGGLGDEENSYYRNLLQRSLIGEGNKVNVDNPNFLMPIESNYFSQQGKPTSNIMDFLKSISS